MADFNNLREQAKQWLSNMFVPKELSPEGIANTGAGATGMALGAVTQPGVVPAMYMLDKLLKTNAGKQIQTMLDATGPMGGGLDDIVIAGAKTAPAALGMVAPLVSNLGRMKPRGVPAKSSEWFHSNLAEAVDKAWLNHGEPSDLLSIKQVKAWLNKLPGMGVKKEEIKHFNLNQHLQDLTDLGEAKFTKQQLANIIDRKMPNIVRLGDTANPYKQYTLPDGSNYDVQLLTSKDIYAPGPYGAEKINPIVDPNATHEGHWPNVPEDTANVLQHIRTTDRILPDGRKALYAEEVQSDWQQQYPETYPLVQNYEDLTHKYLYRKAADEGYDSVAWAPGSVHIQRWGGSKEPARPVSRIFDLDYLSDKNEPGNLWQQYSDEIDKLEQDNPLIVPTNYYGEPSPDWLELIRPIQQKYINLANEQGIMAGGKDERFSGFESFYNKRMVDSATGMLKRMGGGRVSETDLPSQVVKSHDPEELADAIIHGGFNPKPDSYYTGKPQEPIDIILDRYKNEFSPAKGFIQPAPHKSFVYDIKPEDKAKPGQDDWAKPMAGKTVPLWMLLSGFAFDQLRGDKK